MLADTQFKKKKEKKKREKEDEDVAAWILDVLLSWG